MEEWDTSWHSSTKTLLISVFNCHSKLCTNGVEVKVKLINTLKLIHLHVIGLPNWYVKCMVSFINGTVSRDECCLHCRIAVCQKNYKKISPVLHFIIDIVP